MTMDHPSRLAASQKHNKSTISVLLYCCGGEQTLRENGKYSPPPPPSSAHEAISRKLRVIFKLFL